jgi:hypothetical protein
MKVVVSFSSRFVNLAEARRVHGDRVDRVGRFLSEVDGRADAAVEAIEGLPKGVGFALFERGLAAGPSAIPEAPLALRELLEEAEDVPGWVDWDACARGGEVFLRAGPIAGAVLGTRSLVVGYASPAGNKPLVFSGRLKEQASRRLNETARFVQAVSRPGGMKVHADGWRITLKVRLIHAQVRRMLLRSGRWNAGAWGAPVNQHDMAGTTLLFSQAILDGCRHLGMDISRSEGEDYMHLWRWVGRVIGVHPDILPACEADGVRLARLIEMTMGAPDQDSRDLTKALFDSAFEGAKTRQEIRLATRRSTFGQALCRELVGDPLADALGIPRTSFRYALPVMKRIVRGVGRVTRRVPMAERSAVAAGARYWDRVVQIGLQNASYEFGLPDRLGALAA